jgi:hypothetical protein
VASRANFDPDVFLGGAGNELIAARATDCRFRIFGMDIGFHDLTPAINA